MPDPANVTPSTGRGRGRFLLTLAAVVYGLLGLRRLSVRSGATDAEVAAVLPGDGLLTGATVVVDRAVTLPAPADQVWPWLVQLGKKRAGWYFSKRLGSLLPARGRGLRHIEPKWQNLQVGELIPDWGPGDPSFRAELINPGRALVYLSLRDAAADHRWPADDDDQRPGVTALSWALILTDLGNTSRLHIRLKMRLRTSRRLIGTLGGLVDWLTVKWLFAGLTERVRTAGW